MNYFENDSHVPFIVAVNLFDGLQTHPVAQVREALGLAESSRWSPVTPGTAGRRWRHCSRP